MWRRRPVRGSLWGEVFKEQPAPEDIPPHGSIWNKGWRFWLLVGYAVFLLIMWVVTIGTLLGVM